jgi:hypothetical protein
MIVPRVPPISVRRIFVGDSQLTCTLPVNLLPNCKVTRASYTGEPAELLTPVAATAVGNRPAM